MNTELFIAKRFIHSQGANKKHTLPIIRLSVIAIAMSIAVMILSVAIVTGFKNEIRNRVIGFGSHIQIKNLDSNNSFETSPIYKEQSFIPILSSLPGIKHIQVFATKPGMIKTKTDVQGVVVKGIGSDFDWSFFQDNLVEGRHFTVTDSSRTNEVMLSASLAKLLNLKLEDEFAMLFIDNKPRMRRFKICGLYKTSLDEFDKQFMLADIGHIQRLNNWDKAQIGGFEIFIDNFDDLELMTSIVKEHSEFQFTEDGRRLEVKNIKQNYPQIFDWLDLLDMNVWVILILMVCVAIINMISGLIILILDRTFSVGLLKALGTKNSSMRNIFLYQAFYLIAKGLAWGNLIALSLMTLQSNLHLIKLDQASYFIDYVPINFSWSNILIINLSALITIFIFMILPVMIVSRIQPVKTLRYN
jgi:lipoprotein-releasing system permease protein